MTRENDVFLIAKGVSAPFFLGEKDVRNGDLIFVKDLSDMGQAIQVSTGNYSHVAIFLDGFIYHASGKAGVICQEPAEFEPTHLYDLMSIQSWKLTW